MKKISNNDVYSNGGEFSHELRAQPRKSDFNRQKSVPHVIHEDDSDENVARHTHRSEPSKNIVRVQLRRIQQLF